MAGKLRKFWQLLNTDIRVLGKPGDVAEAGTEVTKFALEFGLALGLFSAVANPAGIALAGLSGVGLAIKGVRLYSQKTGNKPTLEAWVAIASPLAYLESLNELLQKNDSLRQLATVPPGEIAQLGEFKLDEELAKNALGCFHKSELAQAFNQQLSAQLQQVGIDKYQAAIISGWVAWGTHRYMMPALSEAEDSVEPLAKLYAAGKGAEVDKYESVEEYLQEQISPNKNNPRWRVFDEEFTFPDIYVPLQARQLDANGKVDKQAEPTDLEDWAKKLLNNSDSRDQIMFIQGGPGRGKSVFCRMFADWVRQHLHPLWTPVLIRLRDIGAFEPSLENTLKAAVQADFAKSDHGWLTDENTRFLFLLDGFDELRMEGRTSGGIEKFLKQVGNYQLSCAQNPQLGHRFLITGRELALQGIEQFMPRNLKRVEISPMDSQLQQQWLGKWGKLVGEDKALAFKEFLQAESCPKRVKELAREPLLLYLLAAMHRDGEITAQMFAEASGVQAKILIYQKSIDLLQKSSKKEINRSV
ncbi:NACHT domain-containing protein [Lyngbya aestuarii]|uniref:NACHT domain-containing protein n=1 Tax=Lyngbya aestuarii TaxID=118322 RepID=UPI00403E0289